MAAEWKPWETFAEEPPVLNILGPPCEGCKFWKPQRKYSEYGGSQHYEGVVLCHSETMHSDFSCYRKRDSEE